MPRIVLSRNSSERKTMFEKFFEENNLPRYKTKQLYEQYYKNSIQSWDELTTWSLELREKIKKEVPFCLLENFQEFTSKDKRTIKVLSYTKEGAPIETVLMKAKFRNTVCVSCMSGCPVGCKFCATGRMKFKKNLSTQEILDQIMYFKRKLYQTNETITNVVFMGMGEPMLNMENVSEAIKVITNEEMIGLSHRRVTVSTVGYIEPLKKFLNKDLGVKIAISLHAPNQHIRERIMPTVAKDNHIDDLMELLISFQKKKNKKITYEYILLKDINDSVKNAKELAALLKNQIVLVNLINFNPSEGIKFEPSHKLNVEAFQKILTARGINNTLRHSYGNDVSGACGQLANLNS